MLQRAASNAYSWWAASHIRTKQSKWLEQNLQDMEEKVTSMIKLIEEDGDSFAKRAEMYYKRRPELINFVEESFRAYRALAERFDHISKELQSANNTLASAFPDQFQFMMDDDDDFASPRVSKGGWMVHPRDLSSNIPEAPKQFPTSNIKALMALTKGIGSNNNKNKPPPKKTVGKLANKLKNVPKSGLTESQAIEEIDKLQKTILTKQTEKEFTKSSYEKGVAKYLQIEEEITQLQGKISKLQDEFGVGKDIEDDEARTLMAEAALKSCEETLSQLKDKQEKSALEAKAQREKIKEARNRILSFIAINKGGDSLGSGQDNMPPVDREQQQEASKVEESLNLASLDDDGLEQAEMSSQTKELEMLRDKIKEHFEADSSLTVTEVAEKINELVSKVVNFEMAVSSQNALIERLRFETDDLQLQIKTLEDDNTNLVDGTNTLTDQLKDMEEKLQNLQDLDRRVERRSVNLQAQFTEAHHDIDDISEKLPSLKVEEEELEEETPKGSEEVAVHQLKGNDGVKEVVKEGSLSSLVLRGEGQATASGVRKKKPISFRPEKSPQGQERVEEEVKGSALETPKQEQEQEQARVPKQAEEEHTSPQEKVDERRDSALLPSDTGAASNTPPTQQDTTPQQAEKQHTSSQEEVGEKRDSPSHPSTVSLGASPSLSTTVTPGPSNTPQIQQGTTSQQAEQLHTTFQEEVDQIRDSPFISTEIPGPSNSAQLQQADTNQIRDSPYVSTEIPEASSSAQLQQADTNPQQAQQHTSSQAQVEQMRDSPLLSAETAGTSSSSHQNQQDTTRQQPEQTHTFSQATQPQKKERIPSQEEGDEPNWKELFMKGLEGEKEKLILNEYTSILRNYKDVKKKLTEVESKNLKELNELRSLNAKKDEEILSLRQRLMILQRKLEEYMNMNGDQISNALDIPEKDDEEIKFIVIDQPTVMSPVEAKLRAEIDEILEENLEFWMRFSASFSQIQKFQDEIEDLQKELQKIEKKKKKEGSSPGSSRSTSPTLKSEIRPIYKHLAEIQTELGVWVEKSVSLKDELQRRFTQLCNVQENITRALNEGAVDDEMIFTSYQAAKFQGEVLNMKQENNKVADELQAGLDHATILQLELERTLNRLGDELGLSASKNQSHQMRHTPSRNRVPLKSFIFGVKPKKQKQSMFPTLNKKYQQLKFGEH